VKIVRHRMLLRHHVLAGAHGCCIRYRCISFFERKPVNSPRSRKRCAVFPKCCSPQTLLGAAACCYAQDGLDSFVCLTPQRGEVGMWGRRCNIKSCIEEPRVELVDREGRLYKHREEWSYPLATHKRRRRSACCGVSSAAAISAAASATCGRWLGV